MENSIVEAEREVIWKVMSEFFVDNEIDYDHWAQKISKYPMHILKDIYFNEVAPVCGPNVLTPAPPIWQGFDVESVVKEIKANLSRRRDSFFYRIRYDADVLFYRVACHRFWTPVEQAILRNRNGQT